MTKNFKKKIVSLDRFRHLTASHTYNRLLYSGKPFDRVRILCKMHVLLCAQNGSDKRMFNFQD